MTEDVHTITEAPEPEQTEEKAPYQFKPGEVIVAEGDTAYSFTDSSDFASFELSAVRRHVIVARLRAMAAALEDA